MPLGWMPTIEDEDVCECCLMGMKPIKMKRQWVHYFPLKGRIIICNQEGLTSQLKCDKI